MIVFSSMNPEQIDLGRSNSRGIVDFKHFLEFAKNGPRAIAEAFAPTGRDTESPFEDAVKAALEARNWIVHPQVGVSYFRVDFGIVHPDKPGVYLAGVEADGAQFHRSATARDRDKLRQAALENLGWRILRIWSTEWWLDSTAAVEKVHHRLVAILEQDRASVPPAPPDTHEEATEEAPDLVSTEPPPAFEDDHHSEGIHAVEAAIAAAPATPHEQEPIRLYATAVTNPKTLEIPPVKNSAETYREANPAEVATPDQSRFYDPTYRPELRKMVDHVISVEGPIYFDLLVDRISRAHSFQRAKQTIREIIRSALGRGRYPHTEDDGQQLIWPAEADTKSPCAWRAGGSRHHNQIPLVEIAGLARNLLAAEPDDEEIVRSIQEAVGLARLTTPTRERFLRAIAIARKPEAGPLL